MIQQTNKAAKGHQQMNRKCQNNTYLIKIKNKPLIFFN